MYSGHYPKIFVAPKNARNAETKCWSGAVPILLLALLASTTSAYTSLGVSQELNPRPQLLKALLYHSATSALDCCVKGWLRELLASHQLRELPSISQPTFTALLSMVGRTRAVRFDSNSYPIGIDAHPLCCMVNAPHLFEDLKLGEAGEVKGIKSGIDIKGTGTLTITA